MLEREDPNDINPDEQLKKIKGPNDIKTNEPLKKSDNLDISSFLNKKPLKKLDPNDMLKMLEKKDLNDINPDEKLKTIKLPSDIKTNKPLKKSDNFDISFFLNKKPLKKLDPNDMLKILEKEDPNNINPDEQLKKIKLPSDIKSNKPLKKLDPSDMVKMLDKNEQAKTDETSKEFYKNEAQSAFATIKIFDKKISENRKMSSETSEIINTLTELYDLRGTYFLNNIKNDLEKNIFTNIRLIDTEINQLQDELRYQEGSDVFTSQNEFVKLLILLTQLRTKTNSKMLKNGIKRQLKELYISKQITKQVYNNLIKTIT